MLVGGILAMNHLTNDDKERLLSQMRKMDYVTSYDMMQRKGTMYQVKNRQPRKMLKIRNCYCEKKFRDGFYELVSHYISYKCSSSMNVSPCAVQKYCNIGHFFACKQAEIFREIDEIVTKHKSINNSKELIEEMKFKINRQLKRIESENDEILDEEEFEEIRTIEYFADISDKELLDLHSEELVKIKNKINQLLKNQKKIIERINKEN